MSSGTVLAYFAASTTTTNDSSGFSASHQEINIDPESLTPKVPNWKDLKPCHLTYYLEFQGHTGFVKSLFVQISGQWTTYGSTDELCAYVWLKMVVASKLRILVEMSSMLHGIPFLIFISSQFFYEKT
ncbi:ribosome biogenesis protein BOP1-like protein isoform X1 [Iris pallida]|uniref:Ribosome biogenesis protein BOP1-like protein isoform X1 n=1 Tax=Iris pallida TaxID=29817 RepID=A0AAX6GDE0_IRIPA|nr:ribosome biogenesis protein BOP1-like protein isoform X1 [Iris pallida]